MNTTLTLDSRAKSAEYLQGKFNPQKQGLQENTVHARRNHERAWSHRQQRDEEQESGNTRTHS